jgi:hypothetical protein
MRAWPESRPRTSSNTTAIAVATRERSRFASPGTAFASCSTTGTRARLAASIGGTLA